MLRLGVLRLEQLDRHLLAVELGAPHRAELAAAESGPLDEAYVGGGS